MTAGKAPGLDAAGLAPMLRPMLARAAVGTYHFIHGTLGLPGAGWLLRRLARVLPALRAAPLHLSGVGTAQLDLGDLAAYSLLNYGLGEPDNHQHLLALMEQALPAGGVLWDVGANVGLVSAHFARSSKRPAAIHAFEPVPGPHRTLASLFAGHPVVRIHPVGLGARDETVRIQYCPASSSLNSLHRELPGGQPIPIQIRRGDSLRAELGLSAPHVIKVDVEGFEPEVFTGIAETIAEAQPVIFYEHIMLTDEQVRALVPAGYTLRFLLEDGTQVTDLARRMAGHNAVLWPPGHALA